MSFEVGEALTPQPLRTLVASAAVSLQGWEQVAPALRASPLVPSLGAKGMHKGSAGRIHRSTLLRGDSGSEGGL